MQEASWSKELSKLAEELQAKFTARTAAAGVPCRAAEVGSIMSFHVCKDPRKRNMQIAAGVRDRLVVVAFWILRIPHLRISMSKHHQPWAEVSRAKASTTAHKLQRPHATLINLSPLRGS